MLLKIVCNMMNFEKAIGCESCFHHTRTDLPKFVEKGIAQKTAGSKPNVIQLRKTLNHSFKRVERF